MNRVLIPFLVLLAACAPTTSPEVAERRAPEAALPPMKSFAAQRGTPANRSNAQISKDFLELSFQMESGRHLPFMTRFEGPVKVAVAPGAPRSLEHDLNQLLARLRAEAGIRISRAKPGETAQITIEAIPRRTLQRAVPQAACFVVPGVSGWNEFKKHRKRNTTDWTKLVKRETATVIIPSDVSPQEVRDCLHEEIAQALGPLNDLYRLPDSIFNDDNFHTVLTGFDMLILKAYYSPSMRNGMTRDEAAKVLPGLIDALNPRGKSRGHSGASSTPRQWTLAVATALSSRSSPQRRVTAAEQAVKIARKYGWQDNRLAFALFVQGRVSIGAQPETAMSAFLEAGSIYKSLYGDSVHAAHVATQMSAFALSAGQNDTAVRIVNEALPATRNSQNAALLATLLMIKAEALEELNRTQEAHIVRLDSLAWGRYGFGSDKNVRDRSVEIASLVPPS